MQGGILNWILGRRKDIGGKISEIKIKPVVNSNIQIMMYQYNVTIFSFGKCTLEMDGVNNGGNWVGSIWKLSVLCLQLF